MKSSNEYVTHYICTMCGECVYVRILHALKHYFVKYVMMKWFPNFICIVDFAANTPAAFSKKEKATTKTHSTKNTVEEHPKKEMCVKIGAEKWTTKVCEFL